VQLRDLPSVDELVRDVNDPLAVTAARVVLEQAREEIRAGAEPGDLKARLRDELTNVRRPRLRRVLNATGVIVHTNLGRAPRRPQGDRSRRGRARRPMEGRAVAQPKSMRLLPVFL
jgi:seryl-tRNA(Sec) selenium transferase